MNDWDEVAPIVPKFLLYLQMTLKKQTMHFRNEMKKQTVDDLKNEVKQWI